METKILLRWIKSAQGYRPLKDRFGEGYLRTVDKWFFVKRGMGGYLVNTFYPHNIIRLPNKCLLEVLDLFEVPVSFTEFIHRLVNNYGAPDGCEVGEVKYTLEGILKFTCLLVQQKFIVPEVFNEYTQLQKWRQIALAKKLVPTQVYIIPSMRCNFRCPSCFIYAGDWKVKQGATMTPKTFDRQLKAVASHLHAKAGEDGVAFTFYGGEPLLNDKLILYAIRKIRLLERKGSFGRPKVRLSMVTNGSLLNAKTAKMLKKHDIFTSVSLDGSEKINDMQRVFKSGKGTFKATAKGIDCLRRVGVRWSLSWTIGPQNIDHVPRDLVWINERFDHPNIAFNFMIGRKKRGAPFKGLSEAQFKRKANDIYDVLQELNIKEGRLQRYKRFVNKNTLPYWFYCAAQDTGQYVLHPNGTIGICHAGLTECGAEFRKPEELGDISSDPMFMSWVEKTTLLKKQCYLQCEYFSLCPGGCSYRIGEITGNRNAVAKEICMVEKFFIERAIIEVCENEGKKRVKSA